MKNKLLNVLQWLRGLDANNKNKLLTGVQWYHSVVFVLFVLVNGFHISSLFLLLSAILMMPIKPIRDFLASRKIKTWMIITLSVVLIFIGMVASPMAETPEQSPNSSTIETTIESEIETTEPIETTTDKSSVQTEPKETVTEATADITTEKATEEPTTESTTSAYTTTATITKEPETIPPIVESEPTPSLDSIIDSIVSGSIISTHGYYSGQPYVAVNNNVPYFTADQMTTTSFEYYSKLDWLGRCGTVAACIGTDIMPTEDRGSIGMVKPTGWQTVKYDNVDGKYLYNRCHLIGFQLTGENANEENLVTGTRYLNVDGMLPFENMVADYVKETGNHVLYRVTPVFEGNNLLCSGVIMEGYSVEDNGEGICFNVYCFNAQPDININYADGSSSAVMVTPIETTPPETEAVTEAPIVEEPVVEEPIPESTGTQYIVNISKSSRKFHYPDCYSVDRMKEENKWYYTGTREDLISQGYSPCQNCNP